MRIPLAAAAVWLATAVAAPGARADGRTVYLNGVDLTNVEVDAQTFESCKVRFDAQGNVHIEAKGFKVVPRKKDKRRAKAVRPTLTKRYFLANKGDADGKVQFDVSVYVNGKKVRSVRSGVRDGVVEITEDLEPGKNRVRVVAKKNLGKAGKRRSYSPKDELEIVIGTGTVAKGIVTLRKTMMSYERNASETGTFTDSFVLETE